MKRIISILIITFSFYQCNAQNAVIALDSLGMRNTENAYYKDLNNDLNPFEGTWLYSNGNTFIKIKLVKINMYHYQAGTNNFYEDLMVGGYQYIKNGIEKINTLADANNSNIGYNASIWGNSIYNNCFYLPVDDCVDGEKRLGLSLEDVITEKHFADLILHKRIINGNEALIANIIFRYSEQDYPNVTTPEPTLPWQGEYILIKQ